MSPTLNVVIFLLRLSVEIIMNVLPLQIKVLYVITLFYLHNIHQNDPHSFFLLRILLINEFINILLICHLISTISIALLILNFSIISITSLILTYSIISIT